MGRRQLLKLARFSIRNQVILLFFVVIALPFVFITYFAYQKSVEAIQNVNSMISLEMIDKNAKNLDGYLKFVGSAQNDIMFSGELQNLLNITPKDALEEIEIATGFSQLTESLSRNPHAYAIRIFPIEPSRYPSFTQSIYRGINIEKEAWFQQAKTMKSPFWQLFLPKDSPKLYLEPIISQIKKLYSLEQSKILGFVAADIKVTTLGDYLAPVKMVDQQQVMLLDGNNAIVYHHDPTMIGSRLSMPGLTELLKKSNRDSKTIEIEGTKYMVTFATLNSNDWKVVSMLPLSVLTKPVSRLEDVSILFLIFYFLLSVVTIAYITTRFTNPIQKMVLSMRKVERGDFSSGWGQAKRSDEIGWLYRGFDTMVRRIDELVQNAEKTAKDKKELEFQVLTHQINPHFLYNTLEAIRWKAESRQADDISAMVSSLGDLLRLSLNEGREISTVERELEHVRAYVNIQNARHDASIRVVYLIDKDIVGLPCLRLLFQPLVENTIKHGMRHRGNGESIKIVIKGRQEQAMLRFEISDNGPGIPKPVRDKLLSPDSNESNKRNGVGIRNVHERLVIYFGERYGLRIIDREGPGAVIELLHPILPKETGNSNR